MRRCTSHSCLLVILASAYCPAQSDQSPHFEVASVKSVTRDVRMGYSEDAEFVRYARLPLTNLIAEAYNVQPDQITGPEWLDIEFYAITAKLPPGTTKEQRPQMMANLLAERFGLVVHRIAKDVTGYELTVAPGGPRQLTPANPVTDAPPDASGRGGFERPKTGADGYPVLGLAFTEASRFDNGMMKTTFRGSMASLASWVRRTIFQSALGETVPVADHTGISGTFDFHLEIPAPAMRLPPLVRLQTGQTFTKDGDPDVGPRDISAALEKQLGLKLKAIKTKLDFIVVDHVNKVPTDN
jgi:uncharacterized protein (TIGR03435 family)